MISLSGGSRRWKEPGHGIAGCFNSELNRKTRNAATEIEVDPVADYAALLKVGSIIARTRKEFHNYLWWERMVEIPPTVASRTDNFSETRLRLQEAIRKMCRQGRADTE
jgi:hypothetical protein